MDLALHMVGYEINAITNYYQAKINKAFYLAIQSSIVKKTRKPFL